MIYQQPNYIVGFKAGADLAKGLAVKHGSDDETVVVAGAGELAIGICQEDTKSGFPMSIAGLGGGAFAVANTTITRGQFLKVASGGKLTPVTTAGDFYVARAQESGVANQVIKVAMCYGYTQA